MDSDCDGFDGRCTPEGEVMVDEVGLGFFGSLPGDGAGSSLSMGPDVTGDGRPDILVGVRQQFASSHEDGDPDQFGGAYVVADFSGPSAELRDVGVRIWGEEYGWGGRHNAIVPDMTGDGIAEVVVTASRYDEVCVFNGPLTANRVRSEADACFRTDTDTAATRAYLAIGVGDQDGDGLTDLLAAGFSNVQEDGQWWGAVGRGLVYYGPLQDGADGSDADAVLRPHHYNEGLGFGFSACTGDVNGDGLTDVVVGGPVMTTESVSSFVQGGKIYVVNGPLQGDMLLDDGLGTLEAAAGMWQGEREDDGAGLDVACGGDVNGDGLADVLTGAPNVYGVGTSTAYLVYGPATGARSLAQADWVLDSELSELGGYVSLESDLNGDGRFDPVLSAEPENGVADALVYFGGGLSGHDELGGEDVHLKLSTAAYTIVSLAGGQDLDGDGYQDLMVGGQHSTEDAEGVGAAWLLFLNPRL